MAALTSSAKVSELTRLSGTARSSARKGLPHVPPLTGNPGKESKKSSKNAAKGKNKPHSEVKKRGHLSTPSNSDDSEKPHPEQTHTEKGSDLKQTKGPAKERSSRKSRKYKTTEPAVEEAAAADAQDNTGLSRQAQESLRWEGALEDPTAEAGRLEIYRANRRKRYMASRQMLSENIHAGLGPVLDVSEQGRAHRTDATANIL